MNEVILNLRLENIEIVDSSKSKVQKPYDLVFVRALGPLKRILRESRIYLKQEDPKLKEKSTKIIRRGEILAYKGKLKKIHEEIDEMRDLKSKFSRLQIHPINVPFLQKEERHIVQIWL